MRLDEAVVAVAMDMLLTRTSKVALPMLRVRGEGLGRDIVALELKFLLPLALPGRGEEEEEELRLSWKEGIVRFVRELRPGRGEEERRS